MVPISELNAAPPSATRTGTNGNRSTAAPRTEAPDEEQSAPARRAPDRLDRDDDERRQRHARIEGHPHREGDAEPDREPPPSVAGLDRSEGDLEALDDRRQHHEDHQQ